MARRLRVQFSGAVYHLMFRGNGWALIFDDDADRVRLTEWVADVLRSRRDSTDRGLVALALIHRCGLTRRDAAVRLGLTCGSAVGYLVRKDKSCARRDFALRQQLENMT